MLVNSSLASLALYMVRSVGGVRNFRAFTDAHKARRWLEGRVLELVAHDLRICLRLLEERGD